MHAAALIGARQPQAAHASVSAAQRLAQTDSEQHRCAVFLSYV